MIQPTPKRSIDRLQSRGAADVLPPFVRMVSVPTIAGDTSPAVPAREAGRQAAAHALQLLGAAGWSLEIGVGPGGEPVWPQGYVGSITHTTTMAVCVVAEGCRLQGIGVDAEPVIEAARAALLSRAVLHACETRLQAPGLDAPTLFTVLLSTKQAVFKCLYPLVRRRFDYRDAAVRQIDALNGSVVVELLTTLAPGYERGLRLTAVFGIDGGVVTTIICLPRDGG